MTVSGKQRLVDGILEYIEKNFNDPSLSLSTMAADLGYNSKYISKMFKEDVGSKYISRMEEMEATAGQME